MLLGGSCDSLKHQHHPDTATKHVLILTALEVLAAGLMDCARKHRASLGHTRSRKR